FAAVVRHSLNSFHTESTLPSDLSSAFNLTSSQYSALVSFCLSLHNLHLSIGLSFFFLGTDRLSSILHNSSLCWVAHASPLIVVTSFTTDLSFVFTRM